MSMCYIGFRAGCHTHVSHLHYADGVLDWRKYHEHRERQHAEIAARCGEGSGLRDCHEEMAAHSARAKLGFEPESVGVSGCERIAGENGFWRCDTPEACAKWRAAMRKIDSSNHVRLDCCALFLDFTKEHAVIRDQGFCNWEDYLPDGWTHEFAELGKDCQEG